MRRSNQALPAAGDRLETIPVVLGPTAFGGALPAQLLTLAASLGMTLLMISAAVS